MQRRSWLCQSITGAAIPACSITVYTAGTLSKATIYGDQAGSSSLGNPITAGSDGTYAYYAPDGRYTEVLSAPGFTFGAAQTQDFILHDAFAIPGTAPNIFATITWLNATPNCTNVTPATAGKTWCFDQTLSALKVYDGTKFATVTSVNAYITNVMDFGAKGDNATDDTAAITSAINKTYSAGSQGTTQPNRVVYFPAGFYKISAVIEVPPNVILRGAGRFSINMGGTNPQGSAINKTHDGVAFRFVDRNGAGVGSLWQMGGIEDMGFSGQGASDTTASRFIELGDASSVTTAIGAWEVFIRRVTFSNSNGYGIYSAHSQMANIEQNWFNQVKFPIYYNTVVSAARIVRNTFLDQTNIAGAIAMQFRIGTLGGATGGPLIQGNYSLGFQRVIWNTSIFGMQIRDNVFEGIYLNAIQLDAFLSDAVTQDGSGPSGTIIDGNTFINWGNAASNQPAIQMNYAQNGWIGVNTYQSPNAAVTTSIIAFFDNGCSPQCTQANIIVDPVCTGVNCSGLAGVVSNSITRQNTILGRNYIQQRQVAGDPSGLVAGQEGRFWFDASGKRMRYFDGSTTYTWASSAVLNLGTGIQVGSPAGGDPGLGFANAQGGYQQAGVVIATMVLTNASGTRTNVPHMVQDTVTLTGGTAGVALAGAAAFTNSTSYTCVCDNDSAVLACRVVQNGGNGFTVSSGAGTDVIRFICTGS